MTQMKLTASAVGAKLGPMTRRMDRKGVRALCVAAASLALASCINVNAPEDAIVIELNVNITATVLYELAESANNTIDENADIF